MVLLPLKVVSPGRNFRTVKTFLSDKLRHWNSPIWTVCHALGEVAYCYCGRYLSDISNVLGIPYMYQKRWCMMVNSHGYSYQKVKKKTQHLLVATWKKCGLRGDYKAAGLQYYKPELVAWVQVDVDDVILEAQLLEEKLTWPAGECAGMDVQRQPHFLRSCLKLGLPSATRYNHLYSSGLGNMHLT